MKTMSLRLFARRWCSEDNVRKVFVRCMVGGPVAGAVAGAVYGATWGGPVTSVVGGVLYGGVAGVFAVPAIVPMAAVSLGLQAIID